jgi:hypothetical protein
VSANIRPALVLAWPAALLLAAILIPRLAQDAAYHQYADQRTLLGLPHFWNVASNGAIAAAGAFGLGVLWRGGPGFAQPVERRLFAGLFVAVLWTAAGSVYYHWHPNTFTLYWDRLPITVALGLLLAITVAERMGGRVAMRAAVPILAAGMASVTYWIATEAAGRGDLTFYFAYQAACLGGLTLLWGLYPPRYSGTSDYVLALTLYAVALAFEQSDRAVFAALGVGGHAIKHGLVGAAIAVLAAMLLRRAPLVRKPG